MAYPPGEGAAYGCAFNPPVWNVEAGERHCTPDWFNDCNTSLTRSKISFHQRRVSLIQVIPLKP